MRMELFFVFLIFGLMGIVLISMNALFGPKKSNPAKELPFECGNPPFRDGIKTFPVKFSLVAFLFLLFDVEAVFFFPWALIFKEKKGPALAIILIYAGVLAAGFIYAWKKGAFDWE